VIVRRHEPVLDPLPESHTGQPGETMMSFSHALSQMQAEACARYRQ
jgi:hypothetical protein